MDYFEPLITERSLFGSHRTRSEFRSMQLPYDALDLHFAHPRIQKRSGMLIAIIVHLCTHHTPNLLALSLYA